MTNRISQIVVAEHDYHGPPGVFDNLMVYVDGLDGWFTKEGFFGLFLGQALCYDRLTFLNLQN